MPVTDIKQDALLRTQARVITQLREVPALRFDETNLLDLTNTNAVLDVIKSHATDPTIFDETPPFVWVAEISSSNRDYYNTKMDVETTLKNFVEDAIAGVTFLDSHQQSEKLGRSFAATLVVDAQGVVRVYAAFYTIPDVSSSRNNTSDLIKRIRSGIEKDVSVGFKRDQGFLMRCSVCGLDMWRNWDCDHFAGETTKVWDEDLQDFREVIVYAVVVNARLGEVSGVYDGATPDAMIEKALYFANRGILKPETQKYLETTLRMTLTKSLDANQRQQSTSDSTESNFEKGENVMANENNPTQNANFVDFQRSCVQIGVVEKEDEIASFKEGFRAINSEITRLRKVEDERNAFFNAEVEDALKEGVRAYADNFKKTMYEGILKRSTLEEVRSFKEEWKAKAEEELAGGRRSTEGEPPATNEEEKDESPKEERQNSVIEQRMMPVENLLNI